ncbi:hypothetical protein [Glycomyces sp. NPDC048151]|uniref:TPR repeat region-containing protein n=1 Tax=Glycomyces sp. NPDC048151 TaxID=3364002 RepID=UPI00371D2B04
MATIPTIGSFDPPDTKAQEGDLSAESGYLQAHSGRIIGRGSDVVGQMRASAVEFTDLVAAPLAREGGKFEGAAQTAMQGAVYGSMVTNRWATWVTEFKGARQALIDEWEAAVGNSFGIRESEVGGVTPNLTKAERAEQAEQATAAAGALKLAEMNQKAKALYEKFKGQAADIGGMLKGGPTPENLQALAAGGIGTWMGFNVFGKDAALPLVGADGKDLAEALAAALKNGDELTPELRALFETMMTLAERAEHLQGREDIALSKGELAFLEQFFAGMDGPGLNGWTEQNMLYYLPEYFKENGYSGADQALLLGAMGGGLMALSQSGLGGGVERLPESLRRHVEYLNGTGKAPFGGGPYDYTEMLEGIAPMLGAAAGQGLDKLQAGRELSTGLVWMIADTIDRQSDAGTDHRNIYNQMNGVEEFGHWQDADKGFAAIMEVVTRDNDLNADLLTGFVKHPEYGDESREHLLRGLFGRKWEDGGAAASKIIDWIPGALHGSDPFLARDAAESYFSVVDTMTNEKAGGHWDQSAFEFFTDGFGKTAGFERAPLGAANPEITNALTSATIPFLDWYAQDPDMVSDKVEESTFVNWTLDPADRTAYLQMHDRANMFELLLGGEASGQALGEAVYAKVYLDGATLPSWGDIDGHNDGEAENRFAGDSDGASEYAAYTGRLLGFLDAGYENVYKDGLDDAALETKQNKQESAWLRGGAAIAKEIVTSLPPVRGARIVWEIAAKEAFEVGKWGPNVTEASGGMFSPGANPGKGADGVTNDEMNFNFAHAIVNTLVSDPDSGRTVEELHDAFPGLTEKDPDTGKWRLKSVEDVTDGYSSRDPNSYSVTDALGDIRDYMGWKNNQRYDTYTKDLFIERFDTGKNYTK